MQKISFHGVVVVVCTIIFIAQTLGYDYRWQGALHYYLSPAYAHWQWLTHLFLHASLIHLLLNMNGLVIFSSALKVVWRDWQIGLLFLVSGLFGAKLYFEMMGSENILLGASGGVYGLMMAFAVMYPRSYLSLWIIVPFSFQAKYLVTVLLTYECWAYFSGYSLFGSNIAHLAHIGGALMGGLCALIFKNLHSQPQ